MGCCYVIVDSDDEGMCTHNLDRVLRSWELNDSTRDKPFPKLLYTVPVRVQAL